MSILKNISRRSFLVSSSALLALPSLEAVTKGRPETTKKMLFIGQGYGFTSKGFFPNFVGRFSDNELPKSMEPIRQHIDEICMVDRLKNTGWFGTHAGSDGFLRTGGTVSCDVLAGSYLSKSSRYQNIVLNSSLYQDGHGRHGLSWGFNGAPVSGIKSSFDFYQKLFGGKESKEELLAKIKQKQSVLDSVKMDGHKFSKQISKTDNEKLEEYFQSIREIELSINKELKWIDVPKPKAPFKFSGQTGVDPKKMDGVKHIKLMYDMIAIALQTGQTNVVSFTLPNQAVLNSMNINNHIHQISHYNSSKDMTEKSIKRDKMNMTLLSYVLTKFKETKDSDGKSLFENSLISYGTNLRSGHGINDVPFILTGGAIKNLKRGEFVRPDHKNTPLSNAWLTVLNEMGVGVNNFGHSTGAERSFIS